MDRSQYTVAQYRLILETLAGRMNTLNDLLILAQSNPNEHSHGLLVDAAQALATSIGGMADSAIGGDIAGGHDCWNYGPLFSELGKAANTQ